MLIDLEKTFAKSVKKSVKQTKVVNKKTYLSTLCVGEVDVEVLNRNLGQRMPWLCQGCHEERHDEGCHGKSVP